MLSMSILHETCMGISCRWLLCAERHNSWCFSNSTSQKPRSVASTAWVQPWSVSSREQRRTSSIRVCSFLSGTKELYWLVCYFVKPCNDERCGKSLTKSKSLCMYVAWGSLLPPFCPPYLLPPCRLATYHLCHHPACSLFICPVFSRPLIHLPFSCWLVSILVRPSNAQTELLSFSMGLVGESLVSNL